MTVLGWAFDPARSAERRREKARASVARAQVRGLARQRRRDQRRRVAHWLGYHKVAFLPVAGVLSIAIGVFTATTLGGFITLGIGLWVIEWRVSK